MPILTGCPLSATAQFSFAGQNGTLSAPAQLETVVCNSTQEVAFVVNVTANGTDIDIDNVTAADDSGCGQPSLDYQGMTATFTCSGVVNGPAKTVQFTAQRMDGEQCCWQPGCMEFRPYL